MWSDYRHSFLINEKYVRLLLIFNCSDVWKKDAWLIFFNLILSALIILWAWEKLCYTITKFIMKVGFTQIE